MGETGSIHNDNVTEEEGAEFYNGTVKQRIIAHLHRLSYRVAGVSSYSYLPITVCQDGIAEAVGVSRPHAAIELGHLEEEGVVGSKLSHVYGTHRRRKVYYLKEFDER